MRGTKTVMVRNNNINSVRRRRASKQSKTLLRLQRAQFNLISKVHYYKHKREGGRKDRERERDKGLDGKFEQKEIFFRLQSFSFYDRTELVLACGPSHQSQVCSCSCEQSAIRNLHPHWHPQLRHVVVAVIMFIAFHFPLDILPAISLL